MPPVGFEHPISAGERPQTHALDRAHQIITITKARGDTSHARTIEVHTIYQQKIKSLEGPTSSFDDHTKVKDVSKV